MNPVTIEIIVVVSLFALLVLLLVLWNRWEYKKYDKKSTSPEEREKTEKMFQRLAEGKPPESIAEAFLGSLGKKIVAGRIVVCPQAVVSYTIPRQPDIGNILAHLISPEEIDDKIKEILTANPNVNLKNFEQQLGITILKVDRPGSKGSGPSGHIIIGSDE